MRLDPLEPDQIRTLATNMLGVVQPFFREQVDPKSIYDKATAVITDEIDKRIATTMRAMLCDLKLEDLISLISHFMDIEEDKAVKASEKRKRKKPRSKTDARH